MTSVDTNKFYISHPEDYYFRQFETRSITNHWFRRRQDVTKQLVQKYYRGDVIADLGCGNCLWMLKGASVVGVDINRSMLLFNRHVFPGSFFGIESDVKVGLPFRSESLDMVVMTEFLEHLDDVSAIAAEINRVLRPGGVLICSVPYGKFPGIWEPIFSFLCMVKGLFLNSDFYRKKCGHQRVFNKKDMEILFYPLIKEECFDIYKLTIFYICRKKVKSIA